MTELEKYKIARTTTVKIKLFFVAGIRKLLKIKN